jgi:hypothetical protein
VISILSVLFIFFCSKVTPYLSIFTRKVVLTAFIFPNVVICCYLNVLMGGANVVGKSGLIKLPKTEQMRCRIRATFHTDPASQSVMQLLDQVAVLLRLRQMHPISIGSRKPRSVKNLQSGTRPCSPLFPIFPDSRATKQSPELYLVKCAWFVSDQLIFTPDGSCRYEAFRG